MRPADHVRANLSDDGLIVLDIQQGRIFTANVFAARIWQSIVVDNKSNDEVVQAIANECNVEPTIVERDVNEFISTLKEQQLIAVV